MALSEQARALGQPTRFAILERLRAADEAMTVADLTAVFGLNHNAVRHHLAVLRRAGLVVVETAPPHGRGRPLHLYRPTSDALAGPETRPHEVMSGMLLELVTTEHSAREIGARTGARLAAERRSDLPGTLVAVTRSLGFQPERLSDRPGLDVLLHSCPFADLASAAVHIVCELHRGIADGVCRSFGVASTSVDLMLADPHQGGCVLQVVEG